MSKETREATDRVVMNPNYYYDLHQEISRFCKRIARLYDVTLHVTTLQTIDIVTKLPLETIESAVNAVIEKEYPGETVKTLSRGGAIYRQVFSKIASDLGHVKLHIAAYLGQNHTTVLYSIRTITNLIEVKDYNTLLIHNKCMHELKSKEQTYNSFSTDSEPVDNTQ
jgi:hypothetical protein